MTSVGPAIIIERNKFRLTRVAGRQAPARFPIAVGQPAYPTPTGIYRIVSKQVNPTWFPPDSPWAAGLGPDPARREQPARHALDGHLGARRSASTARRSPTRSAPRASHGCIRMYIHDAEAVYDQIDIGTPVVIR